MKFRTWSRGDKLSLSNCLVAISGVAVAIIIGYAGYKYTDRGRGGEAEPGNRQQPATMASSIIPCEIWNKVNSLTPYQSELAEKDYNNLEVRWRLRFNGMGRIQSETVGEDREVYLVFFRYECVEKDPISTEHDLGLDIERHKWAYAVYGAVDLDAGFGRFRTADKDTLFDAVGVIAKVDAYTIMLNISSITEVARN